MPPSPSSFHAAEVLLFTGILIQLDSLEDLFGQKPATVSLYLEGKFREFPHNCLHANLIGAILRDYYLMHILQEDSSAGE